MCGHLLTLEEQSVHPTLHTWPQRRRLEAAKGQDYKSQIKAGSLWLSELPGSSNLSLRI